MLNQILAPTVVEPASMNVRVHTHIMMKKQDIWGVDILGSQKFTNNFWLTIVWNFLECCWDSRKFFWFWLEALKAGLRMLRTKSSIKMGACLGLEQVWYFSGVFLPWTFIRTQLSGYSCWWIHTYICSNTVIRFTYQLGSFWLAVRLKMKYFRVRLGFEHHFIYVRCCAEANWSQWTTGAYRIFPRETDHCRRWEPLENLLWSSETFPIYSTSVHESGTIRGLSSFVYFCTKQPWVWVRLSDHEFRLVPRECTTRSIIWKGGKKELRLGQ